MKATVTVESQTVESQNVVGVVKGSDPELADEYVVLTAHLDHVGVGAPINGDDIYNGAMDNASGIATLIESAKVVAAAGAKRSVLFVAVTAEEKGLLGSRYFSLHPTVPKANLVANINMDMFLPLFPMKSVMVLGLDESELGDDIRAVAQGLGLGVQADPRAAAQPLHPQRPVQLHPRGRAGAGHEGGLRGGLAGGQDRRRLDPRALSRAGRRPRPADRPRRRRALHRHDRQAVRAGRQPADPARMEERELLPTVRQAGGRYHALTGRGPGPTSRPLRSSH